MAHSGPPAFLFALFPFFFAGMWCAVCLLLSAIGGWRRLAEHFPARGQPVGQGFFLQSGEVGLAAYNGCLNIHSSTEGFYLSVLLPFRLGHPPLFIPWDAVRNAVTKRFLWMERVKFDVGSPPMATLSLPKKIFEDRLLIA